MFGVVIQNSGSANVKEYTEQEYVSIFDTHALARCYVTTKHNEVNTVGRSILARDGKVCVVYGIKGELLACISAVDMESNLICWATKIYEQLAELNNNKFTLVESIDELWSIYEAAEDDEWMDKAEHMFGLDTTGLADMTIKVEKFRDSLYAFLGDYETKHKGS